MRSDMIGSTGGDRIGVDVVSTARVQRSMENATFVDRILAPEERARDDPEFVAARLAAKEAVAKALGIAPPPWREIAILGEGRPTIRLSGALKERVTSCDVSVSHEGDIVIAVALLRLRAP